MKITGFNAYVIYIAIKNIHFSNSKFDITKHKKIPFKDKLINNWNKTRRLKDGNKFYEIEKKFNTLNSLTFLYSSYYIHNSNFYIQEILEDNFNKVKKNLAELKNIKDIYTNDFYDVIIYCKENNLKAKDLFFNEGRIPPIFNLDISINSLIILNELFDIVKLNEKNKINDLEKERWLSFKIILNKYKLIINNFITQENWKKITNNIIKKN